MSPQLDDSSDKTPEQAEIDRLRSRVAELEAEASSVQEQRDYYEMIHLIANVLIQRHDIESLIEQVMTLACRIADTEHGFLFLLNRSATHSVSRVNMGLFKNGDLSDDDTIHFGPLTQDALESHQLRVVHDYDNWRNRYKTFPQNLIYGLVCVPLLVSSEAIGVFCVAYETERYFTPQILRQLQGFADMASIAIDNFRLYNELQEKERFISQIAGTTPEIISVHDIRTHENLYTNRPIEVVFGYSTDDVRGMRYDGLYDLIHPDDQHLLTDFHHHSDTQDHTHGAFENDCRLRYGDGTWAWVRLRTNVFARDNEGNATHIIASVTDVTAEHNMVTQLQQSEERFRTIFESAMVGIAIGDERGNIVQVNSALIAMLGYSSEDLIGRHYKEFIHHDHLAEANTLVRDLASNKIVSGSIEAQFIRKDTTLMWGRLVGSIIHLGGSKRGMAILEDITEHKAAIEQRLALELEKERIQLLADFVKNVGHDFRTPLSMINTNVHLLRRSDDPDQKDLRLNRIQDQVNHLNRFIDALLLMVRHDSGRPLTQNIISIDLLIKDSIDRVRGKAESQDQKIEYVANPEHMYILGNDDDLYAAIYHVLDNALTYSPTGSVIQVGLIREEMEAVISVTDPGIGIQEEEQERIFERFYKGDHGREAGGLGLGLALARRILEHHGGNIQVQSIYGEGSTFTIRLPTIPYVKQ